MTPDEMAALADEIEASEGIILMDAGVPTQVCIRKTSAVIAMLRDRRKYSLLESQFANCHKEIKNLREALLRVQEPKVRGWSMRDD
jgi:hypothetical protein